MDLSIVIPILNEEKSIFILYKKIIEVVNKLNISYEIIFIDDGSIDNSIKVIEKLYSKDKHVKAISFRKNFGKASAYSAGFTKAKGDIIITMDGDLQDDPKDIPKFIEKINLNYDFINGWKVRKHIEHSFTSMTLSKIFNSFANAISKCKIHDFNCPFKAYKKEVAKNINLYGDMHRYIPLLIHQKGYKIGEIRVKNHPRLYGKRKYGSERLLKGFLDLIAVKYLMTFMKKPLYLFGTSGLICSFSGFAICLYLTLKKVILNVAISGYPLLLLGILMMLIGAQFISLGLIGETIIRINKHPNGYTIKKDIG